MRCDVVTAAAIVGAALLLSGRVLFLVGGNKSGSGSGNTDPAPVTVRLGFLEETQLSVLSIIAGGLALALQPDKMAL